MNWRIIETAPEKVPVHTMISDEHEMRNEQKLVRQGSLWFYPDMSMYVYYRPTHWSYE